jgi:hypothetical protein
MVDKEIIQEWIQKALDAIRRIRSLLMQKLQPII